MVVRVLHPPPLISKKPMIMMIHNDSTLDKWEGPLDYCSGDEEGSNSPWPKNHLYIMYLNVIVKYDMI